MDERTLKEQDTELMKNEINGLNEVYREIANEIGIENARIIHKMFHGTQVSFPGRLYSKEYTHRAIIREYNGKNILKLAKKYDYSERSIWRIIRTSKTKREVFMKVTVKKSRTRFIAIAAALICTLSLTACNSNGTSSQTESSNTVNSSVSADSSSSNNSYEAWSDEIVLSNIIPEVKGTVDHTYENTEEELWITFKSVDDSQYKDYLTACKNRGFTVEEKTDSLGYTAFNADGYQIELTYFGSSEDLTILLKAPMEMDEIIFPIGQAGNAVPKPKSTFGKIDYERDDRFSLYLGNTPKADYNEYVTACIDKGFTVGYRKDDKFYYAYNADGWYVSLEYVGFNVMRIDVRPPEEPDESDQSSDASKPETTNAPETSKPAEADASGLRSDFKEAMDNYESFMNDYVDFMKKYQANPTDLSLITDYATYINKYNELSQSFEKWDSSDMNDAETAYYLEVQTRVNNKLLEVSQ